MIWRMGRRFPAIAIVALTCCVAFCTRTGAAATSAVSEPVARGAQRSGDEAPVAGIDALDRSLILTAKLRGKNILVLDMLDPDRKSTFFGRWLSDEISSDLGTGESEMTVIDRAKFAQALKDSELVQDEPADRKEMMQEGSRLGADTMIVGSYVAIGDKLGVTLSAYDIADASGFSLVNLLGSVRVKLPVSIEMSRNFDDTLDALRPKDGAFNAGEGGISEAMCEYCPPAHLPNSRAKGTVILDLVIDANGQLGKISLQEGQTPQPSEALAKNAIAAVRKWKFKPAVDPDGKPVAAHVQAVTTFK